MPPVRSDDARDSASPPQNTGSVHDKPCSTRQRNWTLSQTPGLGFGLSPSVTMTESDDEDKSRGGQMVTNHLNRCVIKLWRSTGFIPFSCACHCVLVYPLFIISSVCCHYFRNSSEYLQLFLGIPDTGTVPDTGTIYHESP